MASRTEASLDQQIGRMIRMKARKLIKCPEYRDESTGEIEQELRIKWFEVSARHDLERGDIVRFADVVFNNHIRNMIAARRTQKRGGRSTPVGDDVVPGDGPATRADLDCDDLPDENYLNSVDRRIDVRRAVRKLRPDLRRVAQGLAEGGVTAVAESLQMSRMTVYKRIDEIRRHFEEWGLSDYFNQQ